LQHFLQAQLANHEPADLLKQTQLLFGPLQAQLKIFGFWHDPIISFAFERAGRLR
jgi:hypothetical protein